MTASLLAVVPLVLLQPSQAMLDWLTTGFMLPFERPLTVLCFLLTGIVAAWLRREALVLLPLCSLFMLVVGALGQLGDKPGPEISGFLLGAILLFAVAVSLMRHKVTLLCVLPVAVWAYYTGYEYASAASSAAVSLNVLLGVLLSTALQLAIGATAGITLADSLREPLDRFRRAAASFSFTSFF